MEDHQRQDHGAHAAAGKQHLGHGYAGGQALLGTGKQDGDAVLGVEAQPPGQLFHQHQHHRQQYAASQYQPAQLQQRDGLPQPFHHRGAEGTEYHQQDRTLIHVLQPALVLLDPAADPAPGNLSGDKGQQQLHGDLANRPQGIASARFGAEQQHNQKRRDKDAQQAGGGGAAYRCGDVTPGQRGEGDGRLYRGRQRTEKQHAQIEFMAHQRGQQRLERQPQDREQDEGAGKYQQVQSPVSSSGPDGLAGQLGPVHEEQQADRQVGDPAEHHRRLPLHRQHTGHGHGGDQAQGKVVRYKAGSGHAGHLRATAVCGDRRVYCARRLLPNTAARYWPFWPLLSLTQTCQPPPESCLTSSRS